MLELTLGTGTSDGPERLGITIKFALAAESRGDVDANKLQATDAVKKATEAISAFRPTPQIVGQVDSAIGTATKVSTELQTFEDTWNVLLKRMALFNKIVGGIAEVCGIQRLSPSPPELRIDSPIYVVGLVCDIIREPGLCVARHSHQRYSRFITTQALVNQQNRDNGVIRLATTMSNVFSFVEDAEPLKAVEAHKEPIKLLIQQVTECGYFIREYAKQNNFCQSLSPLQFPSLTFIFRDSDGEIYAH